MSSDLRRALVVALALGSLTAVAQDVHISTMTFLGARRVAQDTEAVTSVPLIEQLSLMANGLKAPYVDDLAVVVSAWATLDVPGASLPLQRGPLAGDIDLVYVKGKALGDKLDVKLGRQIVVAGTATMAQMDGAWANFMVRPDVGVSAYGGIPVSPRFNIQRGDVMGGGRGFWRPNFSSEIGASFTHVVQRGRIARSELGLDGRWALRHGLSLDGSIYWALTEYRIAEANVTATWIPMRELLVSAHLQRTAPDLWISRGSIFSVFSMEDRDEAGAAVEWRPRQGLAVGADGFAYLTNATQADTRRYGIQARLYGRLLPATQGGPWLGLDVVANKQFQANDFWAVRFRAGDRLRERFFATGELEFTAFERAVNGQYYSTSAVGTLGYELWKDLRAQVTGVLGFTPFYEPRLEAMAKVAYDFDMRMGGGTP